MKIKNKLIFLIVTLTLLSSSLFGQIKQTEAERDGLKGKVKSVTTTREIIESKNYKDNTLGKLLDMIDLYDESGIQTQALDNEHNYKQVYTVIDGGLTMKSYKLHNENTLKKYTTLTLGPEPEVKPEDERYDSKFIFKYNGQGRIIEFNLIGNTGDLWQKIKYDYDKNGILVEERRYSDGTELNDQYFYKYDSKGNLIETKKVLHRTPKNIVAVTKYSDYKLDSAGNWIERTATDLGEFNRKELKYVMKYVRKIEYYK